ncbi:DUF5361 domain-containing protein [Streptococcus sp. S784/96/1]|uniref:DUF5361 domain-containing protein n=1 Tax=Streptococcus sp. S784/96/1 TaxID=2653499 RepID=UPI0013873DC8|nr:DUF5361 domain-containing protein [Streptococcus sp. S784/96/1]
MIAVDEDALICDLAETYHIYDYRQLPLSKVAVFAFGLRDDSRIKLALSGQGVPFENLLLAGIYDVSNLLLWAKTKDGQKGLNRPQSLTSQLLPQTEKKKELSFGSGEEFEKARLDLLKKLGEGGYDGN